MTVLKKMDYGFTRFFTRVTGFRRDRKGIAAVEFAMLAPVLIIAFLGTFEVSEAITVNRKVSQAAATVGDLVGRLSKIDNKEMENIFDAVAAVVSPYDATKLKTVVAAVGADPNGSSVKVMWSKTRHGTAWAEGSPPPVPLPSGIVVSDKSWAIVTQTTLSYEAVFPTLAEEWFGSSTIEMEEFAYLGLRNGNNGTLEFE